MDAACFEHLLMTGFLLLISTEDKRGEGKIHIKDIFESKKVAPPSAPLTYQNEQLI